MSARKNTGIALNEDNSNFFLADGKGAIRDVSEVKDFMSNYTQGQVREIILNPNAMRTSYRTHALGWDAIWDGCEFRDDGRVFYRGKEQSLLMATWIRNAKKLSDSNLNPYTVWLSEIRKYGREGWISCRMNDVHCVNDPDCVMHSEFWREKPHLRTVPGGASGLDYSHPEVREHMLALLREYCEIFDFDGLELDWLRHFHNFRPGFEAFHADVLTGFIREVRNLLEQTAVRRGHSVKLGVRLPSRPENALDLGYDFFTWNKEKWVDMFVPMDVWPATDYRLPVRLWRKILGEDVILAPGIELGARSAISGGVGITSNPEIDRGFAVQFLQEGADRIYLFNHMSGLTGHNGNQSRKMADILDSIGEFETALRGSRRHIVTFTNTVSYGQIPISNILPKTILPFDGKWSDYVPSDGGTPFLVNIGRTAAKRNAFIILGLSEDSNPASLRVTLNGIECEKTSVPPFVLETFADPIAFKVAGFSAWRVGSGITHDGDNCVGICNCGRMGITVKWLEIFIQSKIPSETESRRG